MKNVSYLYKFERSKYGPDHIYFSFSRQGKRLLSFQAINTLPLIIDVLKKIKIIKQKMLIFTIPISELDFPLYLDYDYYKEKYNRRIDVVRLSAPIYLPISNEDERYHIINNFESLLLESKYIRGSKTEYLETFYYPSAMPSDIYDTHLENLKNGIFML